MKRENRKSTPPRILVAFLLIVLKMPPGGETGRLGPACASLTREYLWRGDPCQLSTGIDVRPCDRWIGQDSAGVHPQSLNRLGQGVSYLLLNSHCLGASALTSSFRSVEPASAAAQSSCCFQRAKTSTILVAPRYQRIPK